MPLYVIATPIGNPEDMTLRGQKLLAEAELIIGEEAKPTRKMLKSVGVSPQKNMELLNEHSSPNEIKELASLCKSQLVALVSDCGTPGFCDPGAELVAECRKQNIEVKCVPGPSSLMALLSVAGQRLDQFYFQGFLPAKTELRKQALNQLKKNRNSLVIMDTPYRLTKTLEDCIQFFPEREITIGLKISHEDERVLKGKAQQLKKQLEGQKAEFILIVS